MGNCTVKVYVEQGAPLVCVYLLVWTANATEWHLSLR